MGWGLGRKSNNSIFRPTVDSYRKSPKPQNDFRNQNVPHGHASYEHASDGRVSYGRVSHGRVSDPDSLRYIRVRND